MRPVAVSLLACVFLSGCTSSSTVSDLAPRPSAETTSSIARPSAPIADDAGYANAGDTGLSLAEEQAADIGGEVETAAFVAPDKPSAATRAYAGQLHRQRFRDAKPINFGKAAPQKLAVHGVDVSRWQGEINWATLRAQGANFVYIKATDGGDHLDPMFRQNWRAAHEAGLKRGAYHFFYWCRVASQQADWFIRNVPKVKGALPPVIDVEWNHLSSCKKRPSRAVVLEKMKVFMERLEAHYGQRPIIYTAPDFYADNLRGEFKDYPFWLRSVAAHPSKRYPGRDWLFWQYSGSGLSQGVNGHIDLNVFHGSEGEWRKWVGRVTG
ncbi:MAG: GH25 family lysozyme [Rhizobiaceae bacterium]